MTEAHNQARRVLSARRDALELVARRLLEKEVIDGEELRSLLSEPHGDAEPPSGSDISQKS
jgi:ATP-dependent Zn protease